MKEIITKSVEETQKFAEACATLVQAGDIITLSGNLGAGKTTFTQGFARGLGMSNRIISPSFVLIRSYVSTRALPIKQLYHIDLYRIHAEKDMEGLGLSEIFEEKDAVVVIEWAERMGSLLPEKRWEINIESLGKHERKIRVNKIV